jgi:hypothetical protein
VLRALVPRLVWRVIEENQKDMGGWLAGLIVEWIVNLGLCCGLRMFSVRLLGESEVGVKMNILI